MRDFFAEIPRRYTVVAIVTPRFRGADGAAKPRHAARNRGVAMATFPFSSERLKLAEPYKSEASAVVARFQLHALEAAHSP